MMKLTILQTGETYYLCVLHHLRGLIFLGYGPLTNSQSECIVSRPVSPAAGLWHMAFSAMLRFAAAGELLRTMKADVGRLQVSPVTSH